MNNPVYLILAAWHSSVTIVTRLQAGWLEEQHSFPVREQLFLFTKPSIAAVAPTQFLALWLPGALSRGLSDQWVKITLQPVLCFGEVCVCVCVWERERERELYAHTAVYLVASYLI
jgi:hypothetical protein